MSVATQAQTGVIKRLKERFGFIRGDDGVDRFFHDSALDGSTFESLREGQRVTFVDVEKSPKGPRAEQVAVVRR